MAETQQAQPRDRDGAVIDATCKFLVTIICLPIILGVLLSWLITIPAVHAITNFRIARRLHKLGDRHTKLYNNKGWTSLVITVIFLGGWLGITCWLTHYLTVNHYWFDGAKPIELLWTYFGVTAWLVLTFDIVIIIVYALSEKKVSQEVLSENAYLLHNKKSFEEKLEDSKPKGFKKWWLICTHYGFIKSQYKKIHTIEFDIKQNQGVESDWVLNNENKVTISYDAMGRGIAIMGTNGTGKTNALLQLVKYGMSLHIPIIFVNGKADDDLTKGIRTLCKKSLYQLKYWTTENNSNFNYNPFKNKSADDITASIMEADDYALAVALNSESKHYKDLNDGIVRTIVKTLLLKEIEIDFLNLYKYSEIEALKTLLHADIKTVSEEVDKYFIEEDKYLLEHEQSVRKIKDLGERQKENFLLQKERDELKRRKRDKAEELVKDVQKDLTPEENDLLDEINDIERSRDLKNQIEMTHSMFKNLKNLDDPKTPKLNHNGESIKELFMDPKLNVFLFNLDTKAHFNDTSRVAKILLHDINLNMKYIKAGAHNGALIINDEFLSFVTYGCATMQEQGRSFGLIPAYAMQTPTGLDQISKTFASRILANCNTRIAFRVLDKAGAETIANLLGTVEDVGKTQQLAKGELTGAGTGVETEKYIHHPSDIRQLADREALITTLKPVEVEKGKVKNVVFPFKEPVEIDFADVDNWQPKANAAQIKKQIPVLDIPPCPDLSDPKNLVVTNPNDQPDQVVKSRRTKTKKGSTIEIVNDAPSSSSVDAEAKKLEDEMKIKCAEVKTANNDEFQKLRQAWWKIKKGDKPINDGYAISPKILQTIITKYYENKIKQLKEEK